MALVLQYHIISSLRLFTLYRFPWHYKYFLLLIDYILTSEIHYSPSPEIEYPNLTTNSVADQLLQLHRHFCPIARIRLISSSMYIKWASVVGSCTKEPSVSHPYHLSKRLSKHHFRAGMYYYETGLLNMTRPLNSKLTTAVVFYWKKNQAKLTFWHEFRGPTSNWEVLTVGGCKWI